MQYSLLELIQPECVAANLEAASDEQAIRQVSGLLVAAGLAGPQFADDVVRRERTFPTGLPTAPYGVAIPHADPDHVYQSGVAIGLLAEPVSFGQMGTDGSTRVMVRAVFLLAIKEREKQTGLIAELMRLLQSQAFLAGIASAENGAAIYARIQEILV